MWTILESKLPATNTLWEFKCRGRRRKRHMCLFFSCGSCLGYFTDAKHKAFCWFLREVSDRLFLVHTLGSFQFEFLMINLTKIDGQHNTSKNYPPKVSHGTWKWPPPIGDSFWKPLYSLRFLVKLGKGIYFSEPQVTITSIPRPMKTTKTPTETPMLTWLHPHGFNDQRGQLRQWSYLDVVRFGGGSKMIKGKISRFEIPHLTLGVIFDVWACWKDEKWLLTTHFLCIRMQHELEVVLNPF